MPVRRISAEAVLRRLAYADELGCPVAACGPGTRLLLVSRDRDGRGQPVGHTGAAMLRGLVRAAGFAVIAPGPAAASGDRISLLPLPVAPGELA